MQHFFSTILKFFYFFYTIHQHYKILGYAAISPEPIGKHELSFESRSQLEVYDASLMPIIFDHFEIEPIETTVENNGQSLIIQMKYSTDKVPLVALEDLPTKYRFYYMYFQWLQKVPNIYGPKNMTFPGELHVVFYDDKFQDFSDAFDLGNGVLVMAFGVKVYPEISSQYKEWQEKLKMVRLPETNAVIENFPLSHWLNTKTQYYCIYDGTLQFMRSELLVKWLDMFEPIKMSPEVIKEFKLLQNANGKPLMNQFQAVVMDKVSKDMNCNHKLFHEKIPENSSKKFNGIVVLIILTQMVGWMWHLDYYKQLM